MFGIEQQASPFLMASLMHAEAQTHITLTLATAIVVVLMVFITAFFVGFSCGRIRPAERRALPTAAEKTGEAHRC